MALSEAYCTWLHRKLPRKQEFCFQDIESYTSNLWENQGIYSDFKGFHLFIQLFMSQVVIYCRQGTVPAV